MANERLSMSESPCGVLNAYLQNLHECVKYKFIKIGRSACKVQINVG
jgi:hypothetical protein